MTEKSKPTKKKTTGVKDGLYKRGNNWYIHVKVNGKKHRRCIGPDKAKAAAVLAEIKKERAVFRVTGEMSGIEGLFKPKIRKTFNEAADAYLAERPHLTPTSKRDYEEILNNYLRPAFGNLYLDQITEEQIALLQADVSRRVSARRVNNIMGPLRFILKICARRKLITDNPSVNVPPLREEDPKIDPLSEEELDAALSVMKPHHRALFTCLAWTGARPDEMFALRFADCNFDRCEITISKGRVRGKEGKTKTRAGNRTISMLSIVKKTLLELKNRTTQHVDGYVFLTKQGIPYDKHVDREWRTALKKAGVRHRPAYQLRHTFASLCLQKGVQPTWVAKTLGHATPQITFKHYARFIDDASNENEKRLEEFLSKKALRGTQKGTHEPTG